MKKIVGGEWVDWMQWLILALPADSPQQRLQAAFKLVFHVAELQQ